MGETYAFPVTLWGTQGVDFPHLGTGGAAVTIGL
jgi:hypothetical protein